jgi:hypothetical protein
MFQLGQKRRFATRKLKQILGDAEYRLLVPPGEFETRRRIAGLRSGWSAGKARVTGY